MGAAAKQDDSRHTWFKSAQSPSICRVNQPLCGSSFLSFTLLFPVLYFKSDIRFFEKPKGVDSSLSVKPSPLPFFKSKLFNLWSYPIKIMLTPYVRVYFFHILILPGLPGYFSDKQAKEPPPEFQMTGENL